MAHILLQKNVSSFCKKAFLSPLTSHHLPLTSYLLPLTTYLLPLTSYLTPLTSKKPLLVRA